MHQFTFSMNTLLAKYRVSLFYFFSTALIVLAVTAAAFYWQKNRMVEENRTLILQNDSILSENIHLKNFLQQQVTVPEKKAGFSAIQYP